MCFTETPGPCVTGCFEGCCGCPSAATVAMVLAIALSNRECKGPSAGIKGIQSQKFGLLLDLLPDELIEPGLPNFAGAVRGSVNAVIFAGSGAVQCHFEADGLTVLRGS